MLCSKLSSTSVMFLIMLEHACMHAWTLGQTLQNSRTVPKIITESAWYSPCLRRSRALVAVHEQQQVTFPRLDCTKSAQAQNPLTKLLSKSLGFHKSEKSTFCPPWTHGLGGLVCISVSSSRFGQPTQLNYFGLKAPSTPGGSDWQIYMLLMIMMARVAIKLKNRPYKRQNNKVLTTGKELVHDHWVQWNNP